MTLPSSGQISLSSLQGEFGGPSNPIYLNSYYKSGSYVLPTNINSNIPSSGQIAYNEFYGAKKGGFSSPANMGGSSSTYYIRTALATSSGSFIAAGYNSNIYPVISTSSNGTSWSSPTLTGYSNYFAVGGIAVNSSGTIVIVGNTNTPQAAFMYSTNGGSTWTSPALMGSAPNASYMYSVFYNGSMFVALGSNGQYNEASASYSTNGTSWSTPTLMGGSTTYDVYMVGAAYSPSLGIWVSVGCNDYNSSGSTPYVSTSSDGQNWTVPFQVSSTVCALTSVVWSSTLSKFIAVGYASVSGTSQAFFTTSTNGTTWSTVTQMPNPNNISVFVYNQGALTIGQNGIFICVGANYSQALSTYYPVFWTSVNGTTWSAPTVIENSVQSELFAAVTNSSGTTVAVGNGPSGGPAQYTIFS
jgi:hypothetical protein